MLAKMFRATGVFQTLLVELENGTATIEVVLHFLVKLAYTNHVLLIISACLYDNT